MTPAGFPHSGTHGSRPAFGSPWLFADRCALLRLPVPRHPPCALLRLTFLCSNHLRFSHPYPCSLRYAYVFSSLSLFSSQGSFSGSMVDQIPLSPCGSSLSVPILPAFFGRHLCLPMVGSSGLEPPTSRLSGVRSNHLSYEPISVAVCRCPSPLRPASSASSAAFSPRSRPWWR